MNICTYIYICIYMYTYIHIYYILRDMHVYTYIYIYIHVTLFLSPFLSRSQLLFLSFFRLSLFAWISNRAIESRWHVVWTRNQQSQFQKMSRYNFKAKTKWGRITVCKIKAQCKGYMGNDHIAIWYRDLESEFGMSGVITLDRVPYLASVLLIDHVTCFFHT